MFNMSDLLIAWQSTEKSYTFPPKDTSLALELISIKSIRYVFLCKTELENWRSYSQL